MGKKIILKLGNIFEIRGKRDGKMYSLPLSLSLITREMQTSRYIDASTKLEKNFMSAFGEMDTQTMRLVGTTFLGSFVYQCLNPVTHGFQV